MAKDGELLLPDRHPQAELFICEVADAVLKSDMASMEHPIFSMSKTPDYKVRRYEAGNVSLVIEPGTHGIATIYDKDVLIYAISKLMKLRNEGHQISRYVSFTAYDFLVFSNRRTNGSAYDSLKGALSRLDGTRIRTNIKTNGEEQWSAFGLIDGATIRRSSSSGRVLEWGVTLSEWLFNAVLAQEVLTLAPDYFRLRKPLERRVYEVGRKHCGHQRKWGVSLDKLHLKCGSTGPLKMFRYRVRELIETNHLPDYSVTYDAAKDVLWFHNRQTMAPHNRLPSPTYILTSEGYDKARKAAPGWDVYVLEQEWRRWMAESHAEAPKSPDRAFAGFCRKWFEREGRP